MPTDQSKFGIHALGFDEAFYADQLRAKAPEFSVARVTTVHKDRFTLSDGLHEMFAEMSGKMLMNAESAFDYPVTGDWVLAQFHNEGTFGIIHSLLPRKSLLKRKAAGRKVDFQLVASNVDTAFILQSLDVDFSLNRVERYLVMIHEGNIQPVVLLSKRDLLPPVEADRKVAEMSAALPKVRVVPFSNKTGEGLETVRELLTPRKTFCLLGSSGVGKTSLLNALIGQEVFTTQEVKERDGKGKHTTTSRQLITLQNGAIIIDSPGMRELGNFASKDGLDETFSEIMNWALQCRFKDCTHRHETGCAVLAAVQNGLLPEERYQNYMKMEKEARYHEMSYLEKRQKDKKFGKMCREVLRFKKIRS